MQIREMEEKDNKTMEQIIKRSLESFKLDIPGTGTAYFNPQLAQFYKQQPNAKYWIEVNEQNEIDRCFLSFLFIHEVTFKK